MLWCGLAPNYGQLLLGRLLVGIFQAPLIIFSPVWADRFSQPDQKTTWMALVQSAAVFGFFLGYGLSGLLTLHGGSYHWRTCFFITAALAASGTVALVSALVDPACFNVPMQPQAAGNSCRRFGKMVGPLLRSPVWWGTAVGLSGIYFIATGLFFWFTDYRPGPARGV